METSDATAIDRARGGDSDAFRQLVERHSQPVFRVAYRMTGNQHDADDVVQETFLRAYRTLDRFEERANFSTWLHRIAVNCSLDLLRARVRHDRHYGGDPEEAEMTGAAKSGAALQDPPVLSAQPQGHVNNALEGVPGHQPPAFVL